MAKRRLEVIISGDAQQLTRALGASGSATEKFGKQTEHVHARIRKSFGGVTASAAKMGAGVVAAYASIEGAKKAVDTTEELAKSTLRLHRNLGLSVKTASEFAAVSKSRNIEQKQLAQTFGILSKQIEGAKGGAKAANDTFKSLGITQKQLKSSNFDQTLGKVSTQLAGMKGGSEKTATAMKLFGRGWQTLLPLLGGGNDKLREQLGLADKYGATFGGKTVGEMKKFIEKQHEAKLAGIGLQVAFGTMVAPALTKVITRVTEFVKQMRDGTGAGGRFADKMRDLWEKLKPGLNALRDIGTFLGHQPRLLALAGAAFVVWKTAAAAAAFQAKAKLIATFLGMGPKAATGGALAGAEFGTAANTASGAKLRGFKWLSIGKLAGAGFAAGFVYAALPAINDLTGGGLSANDVITPQKQGVFDIKQGVLGKRSAGTKLPKLTRKPKKAKSIGQAHTRSGPIAGAASVSSAPAVAPLAAPIRKAAQTLGQYIMSGFADGLGSDSASVGNAAYKGLLFPIESQLAKLEALKERLQAKWDRQDNAAQRGGYASALSKAKAQPMWTRTSSGSGGSGGGRGGLAVVAGGRYLQGMGLNVGESKYFGGVTTNRHGHYKNDHYSGNSIDINAAGGGPGELSKLKVALAKLRKKFGDQIQFTLLEDVGKANQHLHVTFKNAKTAGGGGSGGSGGGGGKWGKILAAAAKMYKIPAAVLRSLIQVESGGNINAVSSAGAFGLTQFIPSTAAHYGVRRGDASSQIMGAARYLRDLGFGKNPAHALNAYNGAQTIGGKVNPYASKVLGGVKNFSGSGGGGGVSFKFNTGRAGDIKGATKDLRDFIREQTRAKKLAAIDLKIKGLEKLKAWRDALTGIADDLKGKVSEAVDAFASKWEETTGKAIDDANSAALDAFDTATQSMIDNGPAAQALKALQDQADAISAKAEDDANAQALEDAKRSGDPRAIAQAQAAIDETARQRKITQATKDAEDERVKIEGDRAKERKAIEDQMVIDRKARFDTDTANFQTALTAQLDAEIEQLRQRKENYAKFAKDVNAILVANGIAPFSTDADTEAAIKGGPGPLDPNALSHVSLAPGWSIVNGQFVGPDGQVHTDATGHASGGRMDYGRIYRVGELGPENIVSGPAGPRVVPASRSMAASSGGGGGVTQNFYGPLTLGSKRAGERMGHTLAHRLKYG